MSARNTTIAMFLASLLAAGGAIAQQATPQPPAEDMKAAIDDKFRQLDANGDGVVSQEEASKMKGLTERFQTADKNKDGKLDRGEFATALGG